MRLGLIFFLICATISHAAVREDWIDPHEMKIGSNLKPKLKKSMSESSKEQVESNISKETDGRNSNTPTVEENMSLMFLKRTVNLILSSANAEKDDPNLYTGSYQFNADTENYKFLLEFNAKKSISVEDIRRLDTILSAVFIKTYGDSFISKEDIYSVLVHANFLIMFGTCVCLSIMYYLIKNNYGIFYIFSYFLFLVLVVDFAVRYKFLYEEAEKHNLKQMYSDECDTTKMNWGDYFKFVLSNRDCERKIVSPLDVTLNQMKYIIVIPLESFGTGMGKFGNELWQNLPFPWNIIIFPIILIFILGITFLFTIALKDSPFKINLMHLFYLEFGKQHNDKSQICGKTLDKFLEASASTSHRQMIEDTKTSPNKSYRRGKSKNNNNKNSSPHNEKKEVPKSKKNESKNKGESKEQPKDSKEIVEKTFFSTPKKNESEENSELISLKPSSRNSI